MDNAVKIDLDRLSKDDLEVATQLACTIVTLCTAADISPKVGKVGLALLLGAMQRWEENGGGDFGKISPQTFSI